MTLTTANLCGKHSSAADFQIAEPIFKAVGTVRCFSGQISIVKVFEDNVLIRELFKKKISHRILDIDGGGSLRYALLGENLANTAYQNGWQGIIIYRCIRALHTYPFKSHKKRAGELDNTSVFAGVHLKADRYLYTNNDSINVSQNPLT